MRLYVTAQLIDSEGNAIYGWSQEEVVVPEAGADRQQFVLERGQEMLDLLDNAKASVGKQIAATAGNMG